MTTDHQVPPFTMIHRAEQLQKAVATTYDLLVIGGGVTGAGIALDAVSRGLTVCLVEQNDFASGTSSKSTKLIHGGLRYLKQFEVGLVRESGRERAIVHRLAPHLVIPEKMLLPLFKGGTYGKWMTAIGLKVYDFLANVRGVDERKMLSAKATAVKEPLVDTSRLIGGGYYAEYRTDDARLTIELIKKAASYGGDMMSYAEVISFAYHTDGTIQHVVCKDHHTQQSFHLQAKTYVSAAGPWVDTLRKKDSSMTAKRLHLTKGVHIVVPRPRFPLTQSIYFDVSDGRMIFAIPRGRATYIGTTDTNYKGDINRVVATKADAQYLLAAVNSMFPTVQLTIADIESNWAGLRPLIHEEGKKPSELSRKDEIFTSPSGLISIAGGKLTGYRKMAKRVVDRVVKLQQRHHMKCRTRTIPLTHDPLKDTTAVLAYQAEVTSSLDKLGVSDSAYYGWYLTSTYGKQTAIILAQWSNFEDSALAARLLRAELWYGVQYEMVNSLTDFFIRRTGRLYFDIQSVRQYRAIVERDLAKYLHWDMERLAKERSDLDKCIQDASMYYDDTVLGYSSS